MKIEKSYPPNWREIETVFPDAEKHKAIFAYGDTIYNPFDVNVTADLVIHEGVHSMQQGDYPGSWWNKYFMDKDFRLEQELEAYGGQYSFIKDKMPRHLLDWKLDQIADSLAGTLYNTGITFGEAKSKIRQFSKSIK